jgi:hypothetical protein
MSPERELTEAELREKRGEGPDTARLRYLDPSMCRFYPGNFAALHLEITGIWVYGGVYAAYCFPVERRSEFIGIIQSRRTGDDLEIGIVRRLEDFPEDQAELVRAALQRRYFFHTIDRILRIGWDGGYVSMRVDTDKGPASFLMRWSNDRAVSFGRDGKLLIDVDDNRYLIPRVDALPPRERSAFTRIIYW